MMFRPVLSGVAAVCLLVISNTSGAAERLEWKDLEPAWDEPASPFDGLTEDQQSDLADLLWVRDLEKDDSADEELVALAAVARANLVLAGLDVNDLVARSDKYMWQWKLQGESLVEELDGREIQLPGYILPLEYAGTAVREFLLVPYVGACIHAPPPPTNQIVYVRATEAFESEELFMPVWVTGRISTKRSSRNLSFVDGSSDISVGYSLEASLIEPYDE